MTKGVNKMGYIPCEECWHHYEDIDGEEHCKYFEGKAGEDAKCPQEQEEKQQAWLDSRGERD